MWKKSGVFPGRQTGRYHSRGCPGPMSPSLGKAGFQKGHTRQHKHSANGQFWAQGRKLASSLKRLNAYNGADEKQQVQPYGSAQVQDLPCYFLFGYFYKSIRNLPPSNRVTAFQSPDAAVWIISFLHCCFSDGIILPAAARVSLLSQPPERTSR